nr:phosphate acyltransferase PlsX [Bacilli bacterium]
MVKIAVDAMGGDHAPTVPVKATLVSANEHQDTEFILVGDERTIQSHIDVMPSNVKILHAPDVIDQKAEPVKAVRRQKESSLVVCANMLKEQQVDGVISAGNTGAFMVSGLLIVGRIETIDRPALAVILPSFKGGGVLLVDSGANTDCSAHHLEQFARMGSAYMQLTEGRVNPRIGLVNIGSEAQKGDELSKTAYTLLTSTIEHFVGNVEGRELVHDVCDVAVCDGFVGNVLVKFYEGLGMGLEQSLRDMVKTTWRTKLAGYLLRSSFRQLFHRFDYAEYGGAPLLGVKGAMVKAHGSSNVRAYQVAIQQVYKMITSGVVHALEESLQV